MHYNPHDMDRQSGPLIMETCAVALHGLHLMHTARSCCMRIAKRKYVSVCEIHWSLLPSAGSAARMPAEMFTSMELIKLHLQKHRSFTGPRAKFHIHQRISTAPEAQSHWHSRI